MRVPDRYRAGPHRLDSGHWNTPRLTLRQGGVGYCRELTTVLLHTIQRPDLARDRKLTAAFGGLLYRALSTAEYDDHGTNDLDSYLRNFNRIRAANGGG